MSDARDEPERAFDGVLHLDRYPLHTAPGSCVLEFTGRAFSADADASNGGILNQQTGHSTHPHTGPHKEDGEKKMQKILLAETKFKSTSTLVYKTNKLTEFSKLSK